MRKIKIFDTTLRDGDQSPGLSVTKKKKLKIAKLLDGLGVDKIELGFPYASKTDYETIKQAKNLKAEIVALARPKEDDIKKAKEAGANSIHIFIPSSPKFIKTLYKTPKALFEETEKALKLSRELKLKAELSLMDAPRADIKTIKKLIKISEKNKASTINIADTTGISSPQKSAELIKKIKKITRLPVSVHFHNDLGLATANTLEALAAGADQAHVTIAGIGERCGNAALEEVTVAAQELYGLKTNIKLPKLKETADQITKILNLQLSNSKPVTGKNMFCHNNSLHINNPQLFEAIAPGTIGAKRTPLFGKHSGKSSIKKTLARNKIKTNEKNLEQITKEVRSQGEKGKTITEKQLIKLFKRI